MVPPARQRGWVVVRGDLRDRIRHGDREQRPLAQAEMGVGGIDITGPGEEGRNRQEGTGQ
jgi:hypothetical protein